MAPTLRQPHLLAVLLVTASLSAVPECFGQKKDEVQVTVDTSEVPRHSEWAKEAKQLIQQWHPRLINLIPKPGVEPSRVITLKIRNAEKGVGATSGSRITISSGWIDKHPDDIGLVFHELVHVIQAYPSGDPWWVTEGIADYLRWGIYEGKPLSEFPKPREPQGYRKGYQAAAGFLLWIESERDPGIVKRINSAMRSSTYSDDLFLERTGQSLDDLWLEYVGLK